LPRHAFKFPPDVNEAVRTYVQSAVDALSPRAFQQEANYTAALMGRLVGVAYDGALGHVELETTVVNDRGRGSAEHEFGADCAITATISDGQKKIRKVILIQAKLGAIDDLTPSGLENLRAQISRMKKVVPAPKVMEIPTVGERRYPSIVSGNRVLAEETYRPVQLADYFVSRVLTTFDGCTSQRALDRVRDSSLLQLNVRASFAS
jgi:hypothetical protein